MAEEDRRGVRTGVTPPDAAQLLHAASLCSRSHGRSSTQLTAQEFSARPGVVRRGASKWPATQLWTYDYLRKDGGVGHARVDAVDASSLASQASTHLSGRLRDVWDEAAKPG